MLRQSLAATMVRRGSGAGGKVSPVRDCNSFSLNAAEAGAVLEKAWQARHPGEALPHKDLEELLAGDKYLKLLSAGDSSNSSSKVVQLDVHRLLDHRLVVTSSKCPSASASPASTPGSVSSKQPTSKAAANAGYRAAPPTAGGAAAVGTAGKAARQKPPVATMPKWVLLKFIQRHSWDGDAGFNLMKRALATVLVNIAAANEADCPLKPITQHIAKAGGVLHKFWLSRHGSEPKPYNRMADVLGNDPFLSIVDGPHQRNELVRLDIQLACQIIQSANPGIVEAVVKGQQLLATTDESSYGMSPYAAGAALVAIWNQHHPNQPRPYTTLPSAFDGDRYLQLKLGHGGYMVQLDVQQLCMDCQKTMQELQADWDSVAAAGATAMTVQAAGNLPDTAVAADGLEVGTTSHPQTTSSSDTTAVGVPHATDPPVSPTALQPYSPMAAAALAAQHTQLHTALEGQSHGLLLSSSTPAAVNGSVNPAAAVAVAVGSPFSSGAVCSPLRGQLGEPESHRAAGAGQAKPAGVKDVGQNDVMTQPRVPDMSQLLKLLTLCSGEACASAQVAFVPAALQQLMFSEVEPESVRDQLQQLQGSADDAAHHVKRIHEMESLNSMLDHLLVCPLVALDCTVAEVAGSAGAESNGTGGGPVTELLLVQVLAPPANVGGCSMAAMAYVFEVSAELLMTGRQLNVLLSILLEDSRVVKLVNGAQQVVPWLQQYGINPVGLLDVKMLEALLRPAGILDLPDLVSLQ
eukprot:gene9925-10081_t